MDSLAAGLNVIHGPRASGKTTVVDFLRAMFHGFDPELRTRYLPADGRSFGGRVTLTGPQGQRTIRRYDDGQAGRLKVEHQDGVSAEPASLQELFGRVSPQLLSHVFSIDFECPPRVDVVLDLAERSGFDLANRSPDPIRLSEAEREVGEARQRLAALPEPRDSRELLGDRRRRLIEEITLLETREKLLGDDRNREQARRVALVADLENQLADASRAMSALDVALSQSLERRRLLELEWASLRSEANSAPWQDELRSLDAQLDRWRRTLRDLAVAKSGVTEGACDARGAVSFGGNEQADPRLHLKSMESTTVALQQSLAKLHATSSVDCSCHDLRPSFADALRLLREQIYQACHALNVWQAEVRQRIANAENQQFARCETELQGAIEALTGRRQRLLNSLDRAGATLRPDHAALCECADHPRLLQDSGDRQSRTESLADAIHALDDELRGIDEERERLEWQAKDLGTRLVDARQHAGSLAFDVDSLSDELRSKRDVLVSIDRELADWERRREILARLENLEGHLRSLSAPPGPSPILTEASEYVQRLSDDRLRRIIRDAQGNIEVETDRGERLGWSQLTEAERDQAFLALGLSLALACQQRGAQLPIILNAPFSRYSDSQVASAIRCLQRIASGRQILCFTRDEHAVRAARAANVPVGSLTFGSTNDVSSGRSTRSSSSAPSTPSSRPSQTFWGSRRPAPWDSEEFPGELADRMRRNSRSDAVGYGSSPNADIVSMGARESGVKFYLNRGDAVEDAPSIGPAMARKLEERGVRTVADLLAANPESLAAQLGHSKAKPIRSWQQQAELACRIPALRGHDAQILVALNVTSVEQLAAMTPGELWKRVEPFLSTGDAKRILRNGTKPDLAEITTWINGSRQARSLAAA